MIRRIAIVLVVAWLAFACGSDESKMDRGLVVDQEEAVPGKASEYDMTEAERQAKIDAEEDEKEREEFDEAAGQ